MREAAALGMAGIYVSESHGGSGLSRLDAALIIEALATGCPTIAAYVSIHNMVAGMIDTYGSAAQKSAYLPKLCSMEWLSSYCLTEPAAGSDAAALRTRAVRDGDDYVLNGAKQFISGAGASDLYLVMARTGAAGAGGISAFLIEKGTPGLSFGPNEHKMGWNAQPTAQVIFEDCRIPASAMLGPEGIGFKIAMAGLDGGRLNIAAASLGGARPSAKKSAISRPCNSASPTWQPSSKPPACCSGAPPQRSTRNPRTQPSSAPWPNASAPMPGSRSPTKPCNFTAATATSPITASKKSSAICACTRSWRGLTKS
jgi:hypothetical protein